MRDGTTSGAVTLELDGVLVDSTGPRREALVAALAAEGVGLGATRVVLDPSAEFDQGIADLVDARLLGSALAALDDTGRAIVAARAQREYAARVASGITLVEGARDAIAALASDYRIAVVTGWRRADAERLLALATLDHLVRFVVASDDGPGLASANARYRRALDRMRRAGTASRVTALVGGPHGATAARNAGARAILVGADVLIADLTTARLDALNAVPEPPAAASVRLPLPRPR